MENNLPFIGLGVDIENISRFEKINLDKNKTFLKKIYTINELKYCFRKKNPAPHLAVRFAGKEAVTKAMQSVFSKKILSYNKIEIINKKSGAPTVKIKNKNFQQFNLSISMSHSKDMAMAMVVVWKK